MALNVFAIYRFSCCKSLFLIHNLKWTSQKQDDHLFNERIIDRSYNWTRFFSQQRPNILDTQSSPPNFRRTSSSQIGTRRVQIAKQAPLVMSGFKSCKNLARWFRTCKILARILQDINQSQKINLGTSVLEKN